MRPALLFVALSAFQPALAEKPLHITDAYIRYSSSDGSEFRPTNRIPYAVGTSCYYWVLEFDPGHGSAEIEEELTLPSAGHWNIAPGDGAKVRRDKSASLTKRVVGLANGRASYGWCVAKGDPKGHYRYTLRAGSQILATLPFELVSPTP